MVHYHSGGLRLNPNLYQCGKVCLSLLNTWPGQGCETWNSSNSTILQVLVSIQALLLNAKPYFNEPGFGLSVNTPYGRKESIAYNETAFILSCKTMFVFSTEAPKGGWMLTLNLEKILRLEFRHELRLDNESDTEKDLAAELAREGKWSAATDARNRVLTRLKKDTGLATLLNIKKKHMYATAKLKKFLNKDEVKSALGVEKTTAWVRCNKVVKKALHDDAMKGVKMMVEDVVGKKRVLLYEGALNLKDGVLSVEAWVREMEWEGTPRFLEARGEELRVEGEVAGSVQSWGNLTHVVVFGAGHLAAADRRMNMQAMIEGWVMQTGFVREIR